MTDQKASRTALGTAYLRAAHQLLDAPPLILDDPMVLPLLGPAASKRIHDDAENYRSPERRALRAHVVLRSRYAEDRLAAAVLHGVRQYVLLGAGLDTFALRQPPWAQGLSIVEVDHPGTQDMKRSCLTRAGLAMPKNATLTTIDFEQDSLRDGLLRHGISTDEMTFFSWLGVTMYLKEEAIDSVLSSVALFPGGSEIVLTFNTPPGDSPSPLARRVESYGEPWVTCFEPDMLEAKLRGVGFSEVEFLLPAEVEERYFRHRPQDLPVPKKITIVSARL